MNKKKRREQIEKRHSATHIFIIFFHFSPLLFCCTEWKKKMSKENSIQ